MMNTVLAKLALTVGGSDKGGKTIAWVLAAVLSPLILITAVLCSLASGGAEHNNISLSCLQDAGSFFSSGFGDSRRKFKRGQHRQS